MMSVRRTILLPMLTLSLVALAVDIPRLPAMSAHTVSCGADCTPTVGTPWSVGGSSNVRFDEFIPSGSETDAGLGVYCDSTGMSLSWDIGDFSGSVTSWTYLFEITNSSGNLVDEQTGDLGDVINVNGTSANILSHIAVPRGGSASFSIFINGGENGSVDAGAYFKGVQSGC
jgi:hypothetical protein